MRFNIYWLLAFITTQKDIQAWVGMNAIPPCGTTRCKDTGGSCPEHGFSIELLEMFGEFFARIDGSLWDRMAKRPALSQSLLFESPLSSSEGQ